MLKSKSLVAALFVFSVAIYTLLLGIFFLLVEFLPKSILGWSSSLFYILALISLSTFGVYFIRMWEYLKKK